MTNREIAVVLDRIADILQVKGEDYYKIRAYRAAAHSVYRLDEDIKVLYKANRISDIPGVGKAIKAKIEELLEKGSCEYLDKLLQEVPPGVLEMLRIPGIGHKTVKTIYEETGIDNLDDLLKAAQLKQIRVLPGMGGKTEYNIKKGIEILRSSGGKVTRGLALPLAEELRDCLLESAAVEQASIVGSIRRGKSLVSDIDILAASDDSEKVYSIISAYPGIREIQQANGDNIKGKLNYGIDFEVIIVKPHEYYPSMVWTTGSKAHREVLFNNRKAEEFKGLESESEVYNKLGYEYIVPEMRENKGELEAAKNKQLPRLIAEKDIQGDLHMHSEWSDGAHSIRQMAEAAKKRAYSYIAITDHSKSLPISGGLNEERLAEQGKEIEALNASVKDVHIFKGIEVDILKDGSLDFSDEILEQLDIVVASIHSNFKLDREKQTERISRAIKNPHVDIIGHLSGRLLNRRNGYELDVDRILELAARNKTVLEINSHPDRLDIDEDTARKAREYGIKIAINSDAHQADDLKLMKYGVVNARRAWLESEDIINSWNKESIIDFFKKS